MTNFALILLSTNNYHITVGYYENVTPLEIKIIKIAWNSRVIAKISVQSDGKNDNDFYLVKPPNFTGHQKLIERFQSSEGKFLEHKRSHRMDAVHVEIGAANVNSLSKNNQFQIGNVILIV